jgi:hypothetical protein
MTKNRAFAKLQEMYLSAEKTAFIKSMYRHTIQRERERAGWQRKYLPMPCGSTVHQGRPGEVKGRPICFQ